MTLPHRPVHAERRGRVRILTLDERECPRARHVRTLRRGLPRTLMYHALGDQHGVYRTADSSGDP